MKSATFKKGLLALKGENKTLKIVLLTSMGVIAAMSMTLMNRSQVITIVPPNLTETAWLDKSAASAPYMRAWAVYIANSLGNANPSTVGLLKDSIGPFLDAPIYTQVMKTIDDQIDQIKRDRITLYFTPVRVLTDPVAKGSFWIEGNQGLEGITGNPVVKQVTFQINVDIQGYRPVVTYIDIKQGRARLPSEEQKRNGGKKDTSRHEGQS